MNKRFGELPPTTHIVVFKNGGVAGTFRSVEDAIHYARKCQWTKLSYQVVEVATNRVVWESKP